MNEHKVCESCGMPMIKEEEFGGGDLENCYCANCCDAEGSLKSYDEVLEGMSEFTRKTLGISEEKARKAVKENMARMPAWKNTK